jgi:hypothetical protein
MHKISAPEDTQKEPLTNESSVELQAEKLLHLLSTGKVVLGEVQNRK